MNNCFACEKAARIDISMNADTGEVEGRIVCPHCNTIFPFFSKLDDASLKQLRREKKKGTLDISMVAAKDVELFPDLR